MAHALEVWAEPGDLVGPVMISAITRIRAAGKDIPESMIRFLVHHKDPEVLPVIDEIWLANPTEWESLYGEVGLGGEKRLLTHLSDDKTVIRKSAAKLLGRVGTTERSVPALEKMVAGADTEMKVIIERSLAAIHGREAANPKQ